MTKRFNLLLLVAAVILALLSTVAIMRKLHSLQASQPGANTLTSVVVVTHALGPHQVVTPANIALQSVAATAVEPGAERVLVAVAGHYTTSSWYPGQQVVAGMVASSTSPSAFPLSIPKGDVASTIADDPVTGVDHLISPGDRVDVLVSLSSANGGPMVLTVIQNILVLQADFHPTDLGVSGPATPALTGGSSTTPVDTLTVAVTPAQAERLEYAYSFGQLHVTLRNPADKQTQRLTTITPANFQGKQP